MFRQGSKFTASQNEAGRFGVSHFYNRVERAAYIATRYRHFLTGSVLDVGCSGKHLKPYIQGEYVGVDLYDGADLVINFEHEPLPFDSNRFSCVVCTEVLEHVDNLHYLFKEIIRVSSRYVILSLPNCWGLFWKNILWGRGEAKYYGLPLDPPKDRHKWFFNYEQAQDFIYGMAARNSARVLSCKPYLAQCRPLKYFFGRIVYGKDKRYYNVFASSLWAVLEKHQEC